MEEDVGYDHNSYSYKLLTNCMLQFSGVQNTSSSGGGGVFY